MSNENVKLLKYANYNQKHSEYQGNSILYFFEKKKEIETEV